MDTHTDLPVAPAAVNLFALPSGGFLVRDPAFQHSYTNNPGDIFRSTEAAAFSTLEEALDWLRVNMARPAQEAQKMAAAKASVSNHEGA